jgi:molybdopterin-guanine dinucleotide biosynthesis protein
MNSPEGKSMIPRSSFRICLIQFVRRILSRTRFLRGCDFLQGGTSEAQANRHQCREMVGRRSQSSLVLSCEILFSQPSPGHIQGFGFPNSSPAHTIRNRHCRGSSNITEHSMSESDPKKPLRIHIVGRRNSGKTTLVCELVTALTQRGYRVATIKHTHHHHELDTPGKDSWHHRESGAAAVGILSPRMTAMFFPQQRETASNDSGSDSPSQHDPVAHEIRYQRFETLFSDCDLILVEGDESFRTSLRHR